MLQKRSNLPQEHKSVRHKLKATELSSSEDEHDIVDELQLQIAEMHYELEQQQDYIEQLESERNTKIETFTDGRSTDEFRECCISLLSLGIGRNKIDPAIHTVLRLAGKTVERLPAPSTINDC